MRSSLGRRFQLRLGAFRDHPTGLQCDFDYIAPNPSSTLPFTIETLNATASNSPDLSRRCRFPHTFVHSPRLSWRR
jgi:hypothetical protein